MGLRRVAIRALPSVLVCSAAFAALSSNAAAFDRDPRALVREGLRAEFAGHYSAAFAADSRALRIARVHRDRATEAAALSALGVVEDDLDLEDAALRDDMQAANRYRSLRDRAGTANALGNAGIVQMHVGHYDAALGLFRESLALDRAAGDRRGEADALGRVALVDEIRGRYDQALAHLGTALAMQRAAANVLGEAKARNNIGIVDEHLGRYGAALAMERAARPLFRSVGYRRGEAADLENIALADGDLGRYDDALAVHRAALGIFRALGNRRAEAQDLANTGIVDESLGRYDDGLRTLRDALAIDLKIDNPFGSANALDALGAIEEDLGRDESAQRIFQNALGIHRRIGNPIGEASDYSDIGVAASELGKYDAALEAQVDALELDRRIGNQPGEAGDLANIGGLYERAGRMGSARKAYERARALDAKVGDRLGEAEQLANLGVVESALGANADALASARRALGLERPLGVPEALWRALRVAAHAEAALGLSAQALADYDAALDQIERERAGLARSERRSFFAKKLFVYDEYVDYLIDLHRRFPDRGYDRKALEIFERRHARTFLELVAQSAVRNFSGVPANVVADERSLSLRDERLGLALVKARSAAHPAGRAIVALEDDLERTVAKRDALDRTIRARYPAFFALLHPQPLVADSRDPARLSMAGFQRDVLRPGEALLVYDVLGDRTALWVVTPQAFELAVLPCGSTTIATQAAALSSYVETIEPQINPQTSLRKVGRFASGAYAPVATASAALYDQLVPAGVRPLLAHASTLFVIPTGPLYGFPFETLVTRTAAGDERPHYLVEDAAVAYLSSASLLAVLRSGTERSHAPPIPLLAFADPDYAAPPSTALTGTASIPGVAAQREAALANVASGFPALPGTADEARAAFSALGFSPSKDDLYLGADASVETLDRLNRSGALLNYRYLFFGAHAVMPDEVEGVTNASLVLAHPPAGLLTMGDVFGLSLNARAVVLSACESGRGVVTAGEGVQGLTQAFMYAGTPVVSVTDWKVVDLVQAEFNPKFFAAMAAGRTPAEALQQAKVEMIASDDPAKSQPFFWAPTVIFGDGDAAPN